MSWPTIKIGDSCTLMTGGTPSTNVAEYYENGTVPWIVSGDIHKGEIYDCEKKITELAVKNSNARYLPKDSVLIALNGQGKTRGTVALLRAEGATCNQSIVSINTNNKEELFSDYLFYYLKSQYQQIRNITGDKDRAGLNMPIIRDIEIPLPPLEEQKRIAAILDKADAIRRKRQEAIKLADEFLRAVFLDMFGDPITNPKSWKVKKWGDAGVIKIINGRNQSQALDADGKYPIIGSGGEMGRANDYLCPENTIVIGRKGNINKPLLIKEKFWNVDTAFGLVPNLKELSFNYLYWFCVFFDFERLNKTVTIPSLTKSDLLEIKIPIPDIAKQNKFDLIVEKINGLKVKNSSGLEFSNNSFNALSTRLFNHEN